MDETIITGSPVGKRLVKVKNKETRSLVFNGKKISLSSKILIGRSSGCDIVINDALVSRKHAEIQQIKSVYFIKDLNSQNGTFVNNRNTVNNSYSAII